MIVPATFNLCVMPLSVTEGLEKPVSVQWGCLGKTYFQLRRNILIDLLEF